MKTENLNLAETLNRSPCEIYPVLLYTELLPHFFPSAKLSDYALSIFELTLFRSVLATLISIHMGSPAHSKIP